MRSEALFSNMLHKGKSNLYDLIITAKYNAHIVSSQSNLPALLNPYAQTGRLRFIQHPP